MKKQFSGVATPELTRARTLASTAKALVFKAQFVSLKCYKVLLALVMKDESPGYALTLRIKCDHICEKGSYSLSDCMNLSTHNFHCDKGTILKFSHRILLT